VAGGTVSGAVLSGAPRALPIQNSDIYYSQSYFRRIPSVGSCPYNSAQLSHPDEMVQKPVFEQLARRKLSRSSGLAPHGATGGFETLGGFT
jgi:hypothetical protein